MISVYRKKPEFRRLYSDSDDSRFESWQGKISLYSPRCPGGLWAPSSLLDSGYRGCFPAVKRRTHEVDHECPPSDEVMNEWNYTSNPCMPFFGVEKGNF